MMSPTLTHDLFRDVWGVPSDRGSANAPLAPRVELRWLHVGQGLGGLFAASLMSHLGHGTAKVLGIPILAGSGDWAARGGHHGPVQLGKGLCLSQGRDAGWKLLARMEEDIGIGVLVRTPGTSSHQLSRSEGLKVLRSWMRGSSC